MEMRDECFSTFRNGKEECLCRISIPSKEGKGSGELWETLYTLLKDGCEKGGVVNDKEQNAEARERFSVTPYRYRFVLEPHQIDEDLYSFRAKATLDARFPRGIHLGSTKGFIYDESCDLILPLSAILPYSVRRKLSGRGIMHSAWADENSIHITFSQGEEYIYPLEAFLSYYSPIRKCLICRAEKEKKGIDKRRKL